MIRTLQVGLVLAASALWACPSGGKKNAAKPQGQPPGQTQPGQPASGAPGAQGAGGSSGGIDWSAKIGATQSFDNQSEKIGAASIDTLAMGGPTAAPKIAEFLTDPSPAVRAKAIEMLVKFGKDSEPALPKMHEVLRNVEPKLRIGAARAIVGVGSKKSVPGLENALKDKHPAVLAWAHAGLATLQGDCPDHLRETAQILRDAPPEAASDIADAFERLHCKDPEVVSVLMEALSGEEQVKAAAARSLGTLGPAAAPAVPALIGALKDKSFLVRKAALVAIPGIGPAAVGAVPAILPLLEDQAPRFRELAARALEGIGPGASQAVPALKKATLDSEPGVQAAAKRALAAIVKQIPDPEKEAPKTGAPK